MVSNGVVEITEILPGTRQFYPITSPILMSRFADLTSHTGQTNGKCYVEIRYYVLTGFQRGCRGLRTETFGDIVHSRV